ncbi:MAG: hypothetical protein HYT79_09745 [Elusimicrobia bacterium]|nr:hypothetical protein [Elusimicrobiota bacterium]
MKKDFFAVIVATVILLALASQPLAPKVAAWRAIAYYLVYPTSQTMLSAYRHASSLNDSWSRLFAARQYLDALETAQQERDLEALHQAIVDEHRRTSQELRLETELAAKAPALSRWAPRSVVITYRGLGEEGWTSRACIEELPIPLRWDLPAFQFKQDAGQFVLAGRSWLPAEGSPWKNCFELITSPRHMVSVVVETTGEVALLTGLGEPDRLRLDYLPKESKAQPGDRIITAASSSVYPPGIAVGEILDVDPPRATRLFATAYVRPYMDLARLERLTILDHYPRLEAKP